MTNYTILHQRLQSITPPDVAKLLKNSMTGIEKESLRVSDDGQISQRMHPEGLGAPLTHPWITTDFSESLMEFITPPLEGAEKAHDYLQSIQTFVYQTLDKNNETLWATSMPCLIRGEKDIRIAEYGRSNIAKMKHTYRRGLVARYGKMMQVIAGIHFNHSIAEAFWPAYQIIENNQDSHQAFIDQSYFDQVRNIMRFGWIIPYLFGSSPAICKTFLTGVAAPANMVKLCNGTYYEPEGTSLRMGDVGYTNKKEFEAGIIANYDNCKDYSYSLRQAINTPYAPYADLGVKVNGEYQQLNANLLQIENEYYSTVRPKQPLQGLEKPVDALDRRGVRYVELRSLDINPMEPTGISLSDIRFIEVFMLFCLLQESPKVDAAEHNEIQQNQRLVAHLGRRPDLELHHFGESITLKAWGLELCDEMLSIAQLLDNVHETDAYSNVVKAKHALFNDASLTPSSIMLDEMERYKESFFEYASRKSEEHRDFYLNQELTEKDKMMFQDMAAHSWSDLHQLEEEDKGSFDDFLKSYFAD